MHKFIMTDQMRKGWGGETPIEQALIEWARQFQSMDKVALDIGAHIGDWTVDMALHSRHVYAFEPLQLNFGLLLANTDGLPNVTALPIALSNVTGDVTMHLSNYDSGKTSFLLTPDHLHTNRIQVCTSERLDEMMIPNIGFIKLDVEGAEKRVLEGAVHTLEHSGWPKIIFECWSHEWFAQSRKLLFDYIESLGYTIVPVQWPDMYIAERRG